MNPMKTLQLQGYMVLEPISYQHIWLIVRIWLGTNSAILSPEKHILLIKIGRRVPMQVSLGEEIMMLPLTWISIEIPTNLGQGNSKLLQGIEPRFLQQEM